MTDENKQQMNMEALQQQILQQQLREIEQQLGQIENKKMEFELIKNSLSDIKDKKGNEILVPLGSGVLAKADIKDDQKVLVNIGAGVTVERSIEDAKEIIDSQLGELEKAGEMLQKEIQKYMQG